jgi:hypothetical protein
MESELVDIEFLDIQVAGPGSAKVMTREKWNYTHVNIDTKMPGQTVVEGVIYNLSYELVRKDEKWLVSSVSVLGEDKREDASKDDRPQ